MEVCPGGGIDIQRIHYPVSRIRYLVSYDISDPRRLRRVAKEMEGFGVRLQYSVFECALSETRFAALQSALHELIKHDEDQVLFISLGSASGDSSLVIDSMGLPYEERTRVTII